MITLFVPSLGLRDSFAGSDLGHSLDWDDFLFFAVLHLDVCLHVFHLGSYPEWFVVSSNSIFFYLSFLCLFLDNILFDFRVLNQTKMLHKFVFDISSLLDLMGFHAFVEHPLLSGSLDLLNSLHGLDSLDHQVSVVPYWDISSLFEVKH